MILERAGLASTAGIPECKIMGREASHSGEEIRATSEVDIFLVK